MTKLEQFGAIKRDLDKIETIHSCSKLFIAIGSDIGLFCNKHLMWFRTVSSNHVRLRAIQNYLHRFGVILSDLNDE